MSTPRFLTVLLAVLAGCSSLFAAAGFRLGSPISDHMVLQREKPVAVWGWADAGESVTVAFAGQSKSAVAGADGKWTLKLDALVASAESRTLTVTGKDGHKLEVQDVLVGEVWLGSGQSNMSFTVQSANHFDAEKAAANYPLIREYHEASNPTPTPQAEGKGKWSACTPATVGGYSAVLYFFGREIHKEVGVPVGLINTSVGGTPIEAWTAAEVQLADPATKERYEVALKNFNAFDPAKATAAYEKQLVTWKVAADKAKAEGKETPRKPYEPISFRAFHGGPSGLYNAKVVNLAPYTLRGMLWYQGEGNAGAPELYHTQLTALVTSWRKLWQDEVPFAWVQLPNYRDSDSESWPRIRESMMKTLALPNTGMAITLGLGDPKDIHPKNKQDVGLRLSYWALGSVYGRKVPALSGPLPAGSKVEGASIRVSLKHAEGLKTSDGAAPRGLLIAGADKAWKKASGRIEGSEVVVSSPEVASPVAVRYAWAENPDCNLVNGAGLPATSFRTDDWPLPAAKK